ASLFDPALVPPQHPSPKDLFNANAKNYPALNPYAYATLLQHAPDPAPLFHAVRLLVYSLLWNPASRSRYPVTVFVTHAVDPKQVDQLRREGAVVKQILPADFSGAQSFGDGNLLKVNLWQQGEFSRLVFLDPRLLVLGNIDALFDTPLKICPPPTSLDPRSKSCRYTFAADPDPLLPTDIAGSLMVIRPDDHLHQRLIAAAALLKEHNLPLSDSTVINTLFRQSAPFPFTPLNSLVNSLVVFPNSSIALPSSLVVFPNSSLAIPSYSWNNSLLQMSEFYNKKSQKDELVKLSKAFRAEKNRNNDGRRFGKGSWKKWGYQLEKVGVSTEKVGYQLEKVGYQLEKVGVSTEMVDKND
ncbi:hypothetical protein NEOLI_005080, partial [Neolecta irregularis DAH-3]